MSNDGEQDRMSGKFKQGAGKVTGDDQMRKEGESQERKGKVKEKVENATDSVRGSVKGVTGKD